LADCGFRITVPGIVILIASLLGLSLNSLAFKQQVIFFVSGIFVNFVSQRKTYLDKSETIFQINIIIILPFSAD
jgi:hypothetical protein